MPRRRFAFRVKEDPIQSAIVRTFAYMGRPDVKLIHVPNELADTDAKRIRQARLGMWAGCPDLIFITPAGEPTCFIEAKATKRKVILGSTQDDARIFLEGQGHRWALINDPDKIVSVLESLGLLRLHAVTGGIPV